MSFAWLDTVVIAFVTISIWVGIFRGFVKEVLSLTSWVLAVFIAFRFGGVVASYLAPYGELVASYLASYGEEPVWAKPAAYVAVFLVALIALSMISYLINKSFSATGMSVVDRSLGSVFGAVRAAAIMGILILIGHFLNLQEQSWWKDSQLLEYFQPIADWIKIYLPDWVIQKIEHNALK